MRIAYMLTSLGIGGAEQQAVALAERMVARGHSVELIVLRERQPEEWPTNLEVIYLDMRKTPGSFFRSLLRARRSLREFRPDLIHSHTFHANVVARLLKLLAPWKVISTIHNVYDGGWPRMLAYRLTDGLSVRTTAVSEAAARRYVRLKAVPQRKCIVLTNAIDVAEFAPNLERGAQTRAQLNAGDDFVWLAAGRMTPAKDFPNLMQAFARVWQEYPDTQLWLAGGPSAGRSGRIRYEVMATPKGTLSRTRRLGLRRDMPALLDAADGFVLASAWEGMPLVVGEAMAMEKPVVATDVGGVRELLGTTGTLVPAKSPEGLADAMLAVMRQSSETRRALGRAARQRIVAGFNLEVRAGEWESLYQSIVAN